MSENLKEIDFKALFSASTLVTGSDGDLFSKVAGGIRECDVGYSQDQRHEPEQDLTSADDAQTALATASGRLDKPVETVEKDTESSSPVANLEFYDLFLVKIQTLCSDSPKPRMKWLICYS